MASARIYFQMDVSLPGGQIQSFGDKSSPSIVALDSTAPEIYQDRATIANNAETEVLSTSKITAFKVLAVRPSVVMYLGWRGSNSEADSSVIELRAGVWFYLVNDSTLQYNATFATRMDNATTANDISSVYAANRSGGSGYIDVVALY